MTDSAPLFFAKTTDTRLNQLRPLIDAANSVFTMRNNPYLSGFVDNFLLSQVGTSTTTFTALQVQTIMQSLQQTMLADDDLLETLADIAADRLDH